MFSAIYILTIRGNILIWYLSLTYRYPSGKTFHILFLISCRNVTLNRAYNKNLAFPRGNNLLHLSRPILLNFDFLMGTNDSMGQHVIDPQVNLNQTILKQIIKYMHYLPKAKYCFKSTRMNAWINFIYKCIKNFTDTTV